MVEKFRSNIIRTRNWIACSKCSILFLSLLLFFGIGISSANARSTFQQNIIYASKNVSVDDVVVEPADTTDSWNVTPGLPNPKSVMYKSMIFPGWGQIVNKQIWKVPIIYGLLGGLGYYSVDLTKRYHDYRAAYYNMSHENSDQRFGPTPDYIPADANKEQVRNVRNTYRNRRDLVYVGIVLAYGLNIVDAYVFAHMRSFDVSEDLSMRPNIKPTVTPAATPGIAFSIDFITK